MSGCQRLDTVDRHSVLELFVSAYMDTTYAPVKYSDGRRKKIFFNKGF